MKSLCKSRPQFPYESDTTIRWDSNISNQKFYHHAASVCGGMDHMDPIEHFQWMQHHPVSHSTGIIFLLGTNRPPHPNFADAKQNTTRIHKPQHTRQSSTWSRRTPWGPSTCWIVLAGFSLAIWCKQKWYELIPFPDSNKKGFGCMYESIHTWQSFLNPHMASSKLQAVQQ